MCIQEHACDIFNVLLFIFLRSAGVSPSSAPAGTFITIRGENLGVDERDVESLMICDIEMVLTLDWVSKNKVTARAPKTLSMLLKITLFDLSPLCGLYIDPLYKVTV